MKDSLRVLIVEDSPEDACLIVRELSGGGFEVSSERVVSATAMQAALEAHTWDLVRKQSEATATYIASIVESCDHAIIGTTLDGTVVSWNAGAEHLFGYTASEIAGRSAAVLVPPYRPEDLPETLQRIGKGGPVESCDTAWLRKDGRPIHVLVAISPIKEANQRVIGASLVAHDITRHKLDEDERLSLIQDLTAALVHMGNFGFQTSGR